MIFEDRMAELGVDLSDIKRPDIFGLKTMDEVIQAYHAYYAEIIDRMETRIVNLTGERDCLAAQLCTTCSQVDYDPDAPCECDTCSFLDGGVPEDWRADNE